MEKDSIIEVPKKKSKLIISLFVAMMLLIMVGSGSVAYYFYSKYKTVSSVEKEDIITKIGKFVELPQDENPTLATVTDVEKIKGQPFFAKAQDGDKVVFYANAAQAILFRPSTGKIVNMTIVNAVDEKNVGGTPQEAVETPPVEIPSTKAISTETLSAEPSLSEPRDVASIVATVVLYNGSTKVGVTNTVETQINEQFPLLTVEAKEKATKNDYQGNLIIDLSGKNSDLAKKLAESFNGTVSSIPAGEIAPQSDILIIVGNK